MIAAKSKISVALLAVALTLSNNADAKIIRSPAYHARHANTWQQGQTGTNQCTQWGKSSSDSMCQNIFINSIDDWCVFSAPTPNSEVGNTEREEVAWCTKSGYGTRLIPDGTVTGAHFIKTKRYVQVTARGDFTKLNIAKGDAGGELDPHGADGNGNPIGGLVFSTAFSKDGRPSQIHEWMNYMSDSELCIRACKSKSGQDQALCQHIYDTMGCSWVMPGNYDEHTFDSCEADVALPPGIYGSSTFFQDHGNTPEAHPAPSSSNCKSAASITNGDTTALTAVAKNASSGGSSSSSTTTTSSATATVTAKVNAATSSNGRALAAATSSPSGFSGNGAEMKGGNAAAGLFVAAGAALVAAIAVL
ncbi:hypothetical protein IE81DRAFT_334672 [Ceraceosorus guamensis]|uniref:Macrofage activating glyco protein n=1 Tax=Ceraceosorus guamensis TaxID=1522189 RepID=A0A316VX83_9BASI|nr:hypothetical protein IE81DRAFT_334672 [Ceraceosorus guamensis]PWN42059.1 hypothetical protein IE81DRAFT_334672 [Ceraceosorus guamensis]